MHSCSLGKLCCTKTGMGPTSNFKITDEKQKNHNRPTTTSVHVVRFGDICVVVQFVDNIFDDGNSK